MGGTFWVRASNFDTHQVSENCNVEGTPWLVFARAGLRRIAPRHRVLALPGISETWRFREKLSRLSVASAGRKEIGRRSPQRNPSKSGTSPFSEACANGTRSGTGLSLPAAIIYTAYSGTVVRFGFSQKREHYDWNIEFEAPILLGIPDHAVNPAPLGQYGLGGSYYAANNNSQYSAFIFPKQVFLRIKGEHESLRMGRMEFTDGSEVTLKDATLASLKADRIGQRLIGNFGFSDVMRSLDGLQFLYGNGPWTFTAVSAIPTRGVFQVDGWGWVKTPCDICRTHAPDGNWKEPRGMAHVWNLLQRRPPSSEDGQPPGCRARLRSRRHQHRDVWRTLHPGRANRIGNV